MSSHGVIHFSPKLNFVKAIEDLQPQLKPPVGNKLMFGNDIIVMIVGGPNERSDYHVEMGEELFLQMKGGMNVDIIDPATKQPHRLPINEGEIFLLPAGVPHSPQRYANTCGVVFERKRHPHEIDCLRWYQDNNAATTLADEPCNNKNILYEEYFHCTDLGTQVKEVIFRFRDEQSNTTAASNEGKSLCNPALEPGKLTLLNHIESRSSYLTTKGRLPCNFEEYLQTNTNNNKNIFDSEFVLHVLTSETVLIFPAFVQEIFCWQQTGDSEIQLVWGEEEEEEGQEMVVLSAGEVTMAAAIGYNNATSVGSKRKKLPKGIRVIPTTSSSIVCIINIAQ